MKKRLRKKRRIGTRRSRWKELCRFNGTRSKKHWRWFHIHTSEKIPAGTVFTVSSITIVLKDE